MFTRSISGRLPPRAGSCGDEEDLRVYREDEAHSAAGLPLSCDLDCTLDGRGDDTHPVSEGAFSDLDCHAYHLGVPFPSVLLFGYRSAQPPLVAFTKKRTARPGGAASPERWIRGWRSA